MRLNKPLNTRYKLETIKALQKEAKRTGRSVGYVVRLAVREFLIRQVEAQK